MHAIEHVMKSLLADVANLTGYSEIRGSCLTLQWCLHEAPKLEKQLLGLIENNGRILTKEIYNLGTKNPLSIGTPEFQTELKRVVDQFPTGLQRLALESVLDPKKMRYLRQLLLFCYKAETQHDNQTTVASFNKFVEVNREVGEYSNGLAKAWPVLFDLARKHVQSVLYGVRWERIIPCHGPGAVTTSKSRWTRWYSTIECLYPYSDYMALYFNQDHNGEFTDSGVYDGHIEAKLIAVPKDSRGPRLICVHPAEAMWVQQGIRREIEHAIMSYRTAKGPWPHGHVFFDDQTVNGTIARLSSRSRHYATIDMKDASDRISETLVQMLIGSKYKYLGCCRAQRYYIPASPGFARVEGDVSAYAPMGNATVFPVQTLVFWAICCASLQYHGAHQPGAVFVFGDDIIVPSKYVELVIDDLQSFGLRVNKEKSFWRGAFRESCGVEALNGFDVTPVRWKTTLDAEQLEDMLALSDIAMRLRLAGYDEAAITAYDVLRYRLRSATGQRLFLTNNKDHGGIAEYSEIYSLVYRRAFRHRRFQILVTPVHRIEYKDLVVDNGRWNAVLESLCSLERSARGEVPDRSVSRRLRLIRGWTHMV